MSKQGTILCIDTSDLTLGGLLAVNGEVKNLLIDQGPRDHCKNVITLTDHLLQNAGMQLSDMDAFACIIGPGSFTGLRIGLIAVKTFAHIHQKPLLGINTFERMLQDDHIEGATYLWPAQKNHAYATHNPLASEDDFIFGNIDEITRNASHIYHPQGFVTNHKKSTSLPFDMICGTSLAQRLFAHWNENRVLDTQTCQPLYVQEVAAKKKLNL